MRYSRAMGIVGLIGPGVLLGVAGAATATSPAQDWAVVQRWKLGGVGGWEGSLFCCRWGASVGLVAGGN